MKALVLQSPNEVILKDCPIPVPKEGEALVRLKAAAFNRRDQWARVGLYPGLQYPSILGSDGCGIVEKVSDEKDSFWLNQEVIINPNIHWGNNPEVQSQAYTILGMPTDGTLAEYIAVPIDRLHVKPTHLSSVQAAALPLAGLTAYRAVFKKGEVKQDKNVMVSGIGGGVALFALLFSLAAGAKVYVTSSDDDKLEKAIEIGANFGINYAAPGWYKEFIKKSPKGFDAIIDSGGGKDFGEVAKMLAPAGNMVVYGTTGGTPSPLHLPRLFFTQGSIKGSTMGNDEEFKEMLAFVEKHKIQPIISSVRSLDKAISALDEMAQSKQFGKLVITIND